MSVPREIEGNQGGTTEFFANRRIQNPVPYLFVIRLQVGSGRDFLFPNFVVAASWATHDNRVAGHSRIKKL